MKWHFGLFQIMTNCTVVVNGNCWGEWMGDWGLGADWGGLTTFYNYDNIVQYNLKRKVGVKFTALSGNRKFCWSKPIRSHEVIWKASVTDVYRKKMLWKGMFCRDSIIWIWIILLYENIDFVMYSIFKMSLF